MSPESVQFHRQIADWCAQRYRDHARSGAIVIGVSAPQGAGKTTLTQQVVTILHEKGLRAVAVSIDDFYLTRADQLALARAHPHNPYLQQRAYPGTHDVAFGVQILDTLAQLADDSSLAVPRYDKTAHAGRGDRLPMALWPQVVGALDVVLLEGWLLGFAPLPAMAVAHDPAMAEINAFLSPYAAWTERLGALLHLTVAEPEQVVAWRCEAEAKTRQQGLPALTQAQTRVYAQTFLPALALYPPALQAHPPLPPPRYLVVQLGPDRVPIGRILCSTG